MPNRQTEIKRSLIGYRQNPARDNATYFAAAIECYWQDNWIWGFAVADVPRNFVATMDPIAKRIYENSQDVFSKQMREASHNAHQLGDILDKLAEQNQWSIWATKPEEVICKSIVTEPTQSAEDVGKALLGELLGTCYENLEDSVRTDTAREELPLAAESTIYDLDEISLVRRKRSVWVKAIRVWFSPL